MSYLYFVRHGQTTWNVEGKVCGVTDVELTEKGKQQAVETGMKFLMENISADEILCSPLIRAKETAMKVSEITKIPYRVEPRLIEQNFGRFEGESKFSEDFKNAKKQFGLRHGNGESTLHLAQRIYNLLDEIRLESDGKTYVLVAHNGIARIVHSYFYDLTNEEYGTFSVENCAIVRYDFQ